MKKTDRVVYDRTVVDTETGEILQQETIQRRGSEPPFIKLYVDCLFTFKGLSKSLNPILMAMVRYMTYASTDDPNGGQIIYLNGQIKRNIAQETGKSVSRINQAIQQFIKADIFRRLAPSTFQVNAMLFGKGDWKDIKNIRAMFDFNENYVEADIIEADPEEIEEVEEEIEEVQIPGQSTVIDDYPETVPMAAASKNKKEPLDMK